MRPASARRRALLGGILLVGLVAGVAACPGRSHVMQPSARPSTTSTASASPTTSASASEGPGVAYAEAARPGDVRLLPAPAAQHEPWQPPPSHCPADLIDASRHVFDLGFADPRGLPYHEIDLATGSVWDGRGPVIRTRGWLLPTATAHTRYAVAYNGLVYPVLSVGPTANLAADMRALVAAHRKEREATGDARTGEPTWRDAGVGTTELASVSHQSLSLAKVALMLRLGEGELADALWNEWRSSLGPDPGANPPLLALGGDWLWAMFDRGLTAHMRGEDELALATVYGLPAVAVRLERLADDRGLPRPEGVGADGLPLTRFGFVRTAALLRTDQLRRHRSPAPEADLAALGALPVAERVPKLIDRLDQVAARQWGQPGGVNLADDAIVRALVAVGADAVDPLIDTLENDHRLTRSVHFWRDFARHRTILGVHEAAYYALAVILQESFFEPGSTGDSLTAHGESGRSEVSQKIRSYWQRWRGTTVEERWYRQLADDDAAPDEWIDAARRIADPIDLATDSTDFLAGSPTGLGKPPGRLRGEPLRAKQAPSVTELLTRRIEARSGDVPQICSLAIALARWDPTAARATLRTQMGRVVEASNASAGRTRFGECIAALTIARARDAQDPDAVREYVRWVERITPEGGEPWAARSYFEPMWVLADDRPMLGASRVVFGPRSAWVPLVSTTPAPGGAGWELAELLETPLLRVAGFREHVLRELGNQVIAGSCRLRSDGAAELEMLAGWSSTSSVPADDPHRPMPGNVQSVRVSDYYAYRIASQANAPAFKPYWPLAERNAAIAKMRSFVSALR